MDGMSVVELRQYTLRPGQRDTLIELFDREFVETQEEVGMHLVGQFRDEDDADRFVWIRAFPDMDTREKALKAFYVDGAAWRAHGAAANATMLDTDDVLLLRPARPHSGFTRPTSSRPPVGTDAAPRGRVAVTIYAPVAAEFLSFFEENVVPVMAQNGAQPFAYLQTESADAFVWLARFEDSDRLREHERWLARATLPDLEPWLNRPPRRIRLAPTARSHLR